MANGDIALLRVVGRYQDQNIVNNLHYEITVDAQSPDQILDDLIDAWVTGVQTTWLARHLSSYELIGLKAFGIGGSAKVPRFLAVGTAGSVTGTQLPALVCRTITLYTASSNYRRRGRVMLSGTDAAAIDTSDGSVTDTEITALNGLGTALTTTLSLNDSDFNLCIPPTTVLPVELITNTQARKTPASIRSRRVKQFMIG